jgi:flagellar biosynthesis/type III secretory pathway protein FliH
MILRDAVFSEQLRLIGRPRREPTLPPPPSPPSAAAEMLAAAYDDEPLARDVTIDATPALASPLREPRLTFEAVAAWLAVQDSQTRLDCAQILDTELTQVHETARAAGLEAGRAQGYEEAQRTAEALFATLGSVTHSAEAAFVHEQSKLAEICVEIVAEAFGKIAGELLPTRDAAVQAVAQVLQRVKEGRELVVRVSPPDLAMLERQEAQLAAALPGRKFSLVGDPRIELGGCMVDSKLGSLDGRLEVQLRELYETLRAARAAAVERS